MDASVSVGLLAGFLTTVAFIPQVTRIWKSKSAKDVSLCTFLAFTVGVGLWLVYGVMLQEVAMILWNSVTLLLAIAIVVMKLRYD